MTTNDVLALVKASVSGDEVAQGQLADAYRDAGDEEGVKAVQALTSAIRSCLLLVDAIEATGGLTRDDNAKLVPCGDEAWIDLVDPYLQACYALNHQPLSAGRCSVCDCNFAEDDPGVGSLNTT